MIKLLGTGCWVLVNRNLKNSKPRTENQVPSTKNLIIKCKKLKLPIYQVHTLNMTEAVKNSDTNE